MIDTRAVQQVLDMFRSVFEFSVLLNYSIHPTDNVLLLITIDCGEMSVTREALNFMDFYKHF